MKRLIPCILLALFIAGCSPKEGTNGGAEPTTSPAAEFGKDRGYFKERYGEPKSEKQMGEFSFSLPGHASMIRVVRPFVVQEYQSDKLKATAVFSDTTAPAVWVKYTLPNPWTKEQINAALSAYSSSWKVVQQNLGMDLIMQDRSPVVYATPAGAVAYKTMVNELIVYSPKLYQELRNQIEAADRQRRAVPQF